MWVHMDDWTAWLTFATVDFVVLAAVGMSVAREILRQRALLHLGRARLARWSREIEMAAEERATP